MIKDNYLYRSLDVAKYIVAFANKERIFINMTKLQKLLYIVYGVYLVAQQQRLTDEAPQAWPYGPVFPTTRNKLLKIDFESISFEDLAGNDILDDKALKNIVKIVFATFGEYNASALTEWSHQKGSAWYKTTQRDGFVWGDRIDDGDILDYFKQIVTLNE